MIPVVAADGVIRERLPDETLLAVELVLAGDILDLLRMEETGGGDPVAATLARPELRELFAALRAFAGTEGHRVVYLVGNHDAELWWNPRIRETLQEAGLVDVVGLSYAASFASLPDQLIYCEHGNQFDPASTFADYANPLDTPVGAHIVTEVVRPIGSGAAITRSVDLQAVSNVFPLAAIPQWIAGRIFYQFLGQVLRWLLGPLLVAYAAYEALAAVVPPFEGSLGLRPLFLELAYILGLVGVAFAGAVPHQPPDRRPCGVRDALALSGADRRSGILPGGRGHPPAPGAGPAAAHGRDRRPPRAGRVRLRPHPCPGDLHARAGRPAGDGDRQHRLLAPPAPARRRPAGCPAGVRAHPRPFPCPCTAGPGRPHRRALGPAKASRAAAAMDRARGHRRQDATPTAGRCRATAPGPPGGHPPSGRAVVSAGAAGSAG